MKSVCVYCGSSMGINPEYEAAAVTLGTQLVERDIKLVYGGGNVGLMGVIADTVMAQGGKAVGVIPKALMEHEVGHTSLSRLHIVKDMHERKALMAKMSEGFVALPGGFGTLEELFETLTWLQLGFHKKPCAVLNIAGYYDSLVSFLDTASSEGFVKPLHREMLIESDRADVLLDLMADFTPPATDKWIGFGDEG